MRNMYKILALLVAFVSVSYVTAGYNPGSVKKTFANGDEVLIYAASADEYLAGFNSTQTAVIKSEKSGEENVYVLIEAQSINGNPTFLLQQKTSGLYLQVLSTGGLNMSNRESLAAPFQLVAPTPETCSQWWIRYGEEYDAKVSFDDLTQITYDLLSEETGETVVYRLCSYWTGNNCTMHATYIDTNGWVFYTVDTSARPDIEEIVEQYPVDLFPVGTEPSTYPQELLTAYETAYQMAEMWLANPAASEEQLIEAYNTLYTALEALRNGVIPFEGYYRIISGFAAYYDTQGYEKAMYDNGGQLVWRTLDPEAANQVFSIEKLESGNYAIKNLVTGLYINSCAGQSGSVYSNATLENETLITEVFLSEGYNDGEKQYNLYTSNSTYALHTGGHSSGAGVSGSIVGWNGGFNSGSSWILRAVSAEEVALLTELAAQEIRNTTLAELISNGHKAYNAAANKITGLTSADQISSNADHNALNDSPDGGGIPALLDSNTGTFFHSCWGNGPSENHYLQIEFTELSETFYFEYTRRMSNTNNRPTHIAIWASNDITEWDSITAITEGLPTSSEVNSYQSSYMELPKPYKYLRFVVLATNNEATHNGYPFFTFSEFQVYDIVKMDDSPINLYPEIAAKLIEELEKAELIENATQEDIDALQAAYDDFINAVPDPTELLAFIVTAKSALNAAVEGTEAGQYAVGSKATLLAVIEAAEQAAAGAPSKEAYAAAITALEEALVTFQGMLNTTLDTNKWYYIKGSSQATSYMTDQYMYHRGLDGDVLGFSALEEGDDTYVWRLISLNDSLYAIQNLGTGEFLATTAGSWGTRAATSLMNPGQYELASLGGDAFNINEPGQHPLHGQSNGSVIVHWPGGLGTASVWAFEQVDFVNEEEEIVTILEGYTTESFTTLCLPIALEGIINGMAYSIAGADRNEEGHPTSINLKEFEGGVVPAGVPFILKAEAPEIIFSWGSEGATEATSANGLIGTFTSVLLEEGYGYINGNLVTISNGGYVLSANKAYIDESQIEELEESDDFIDVDGVMTAINKLTVEDANALVDVYNAAGLLLRTKVKAVQATEGLAKGFYIVGTRKVVVN